MFLADGQGSTRQLNYSNGAFGGILEQYDYDAYGEVFAWGLDDPGSIVTRPKIDHLYAGEQW